MQTAGIALTVALFFLSAKPAHAIIFLPAIILIPIAHIIGVIIAGLAVPALAIGTLISALWKKPLVRTLLIVVSVVVLGALAFGIGLKMMNPDRPLF